MSETLEQIERQAKLAKEYGFDYVFIRMPLNEAEKVLDAFKHQEAIQLPQD